LAAIFANVQLRFFAWIWHRFVRSLNELSTATWTNPDTPCAAYCCFVGFAKS